MKTEPRKEAVQWYTVHNVQYNVYLILEPSHKHVYTVLLYMFIVLYTVASAPFVTGLVFMRRFRLYVGTVCSTICLQP